MITKKDMTATVLANDEVAVDHFLMTLAVSRAFRAARPGQFVMVRPEGKGFPFLGRPLGIYSLAESRDGARIEILYGVVGKGTRTLSTLCEGSRVEILGPLGNTFSYGRDIKTAVLVAGGIGTAPLVFLAQELHRSMASPDFQMIAYIGARSAPCIVGHDRLKAFGAKIRVCTDDGSAGANCFVTELFRKDLHTLSPGKTEIFVCGPNGMLKTISQILSHTAIPCHVLMEERMACGMGACLGCTIKVRGPAGVEYRQVCSDGPVFHLKDIVWD